jgi:hypothetical protein
MDPNSLSDSNENNQDYFLGFGARPVKWKIRTAESRANGLRNMVGF